MWPMKTAKKTAAAFLAAAMTLAPAAHAQEGVDWTGGRPLPPGTEVPHEPGYASAWKNYDVIRFGDPNFNNYRVQGVRVMGDYDSDSIMCYMNAKGGRSTCYVDLQPVTSLGWGPGGEVVTVDPTLERFAPSIRAYNEFKTRVYRMFEGQGSSLSS